MNYISAILLVLLFTLSACAPRGESKTLSEIFEIHETKFKAALRSATNSESGKVIPSEVIKLKTVLASQVETFSPEEVIKNIDLLIPKSGYTVRPALTELRNQYKNLSDKKSPNNSAVKLLVARTYSILADELATGSFSL